MLDPLNRAFRMSYLILWVAVFADKPAFPFRQIFFYHSRCFLREMAN